MTSPKGQQKLAGYTRARHYPELDSLRGLAASVVVLGHFVNLWPVASLSPLSRFLLEDVFRFLFNGGCSVVLFFLLSGFVLTLPFKRESELAYGTFALRRIARIYLPYLGALLLALAGDKLFHQPLEVSPWFSQTWTAPLTPGLILNHLLLIGNYDTAQVNTAFWSLVVEMRLSLLFPLLCIPLLRWSRTFAIVSMTVLAIANAALPHFALHRLSAVSFRNASDMSLGVVCFAAGILLARWLEPAQALWGRAPAAARGLFLVLSFVLLEWSGKLASLHFADLAESAGTIAGGCGVLVAVLCWHRAGTVLNHRLPAWLGRVSYSLYLVHATVLFALVHLFFGRLTRLALLAPYLALSMAVATLFFIVVERPCITLSRNIGRKGRMLAHAGPSS